MGVAILGGAGGGSGTMRLNSEASEWIPMAIATAGRRVRELAVERRRGFRSPKNYRTKSSFAARPSDSAKRVTVR